MINKTLELIKNKDINAIKKFGQNFLVDDNILRKIIDLAKIDQGNNVIEIGPGLGSLTEYLLRSTKNVLAFEVDNRMEEILIGRFGESLELIMEDFLTIDLSKYCFGETSIVANIPYFITSDILFKCFQYSDSLTSATLMIQKEVAERLFATPKTKQYGKLTVTTNYFATVEKGFIVKPTSFIPSPKVDSYVIKLNFNKEKVFDDKEYMLFVKRCFQTQRKTLFNNLRQYYDNVKLKTLINEMFGNESIRPQQITPNDFQSLFKKISRF